MGWPALNHGNIPCEYALSSVGTSKHAPTASNPAAAESVPQAVSGSGNGAPLSSHCKLTVVTSTQSVLLQVECVKFFSLALRLPGLTS